MGPTGEASEEVTHPLVDEGSATNTLLEAVQLGLAWQFPIEDKVGGLKEGRLLSELLNRVAAVTQNSLLTVNVGDL